MQFPVFLVTPPKRYCVERIFIPRPPKRYCVERIFIPRPTASGQPPPASLRTPVDLLRIVRYPLIHREC